MTETTAIKKKHPGGRPPKYSDPNVLATAIDSYFVGNERPTICGLALHLGFVSRQSFLDYIERGQEFSDVIKNGKCRVEQSYESNLYNDKPVGSIFALKNMGWRDKQDVEQSGEVTLKVVYDDTVTEGKGQE
jgi:hypothetical protein